MSEQDPSAKDLDYIVPALQRGLRILELFNSDQRNLNMNELAELMGGSVSSIYRIVQTLAAMGYLQKSARTVTSLGLSSSLAGSLTWPAATSSTWPCRT